MHLLSTVYHAKCTCVQSFKEKDMLSSLENADYKVTHAELCVRLTALSFIAAAGDCNRNTQGENVH